MRLPKRNKFNNVKNIQLDYERVYKQKSGIKPNGFWYSCYNSWYDWVKQQEMFDMFEHYEYIHKINFNNNVLTNIHNKDKNKLLVINNEKDFDLFNEIYGYVIKIKGKKSGIGKKFENYFINWPEVSKDYGGIEICPHLISRRHYLWYNTFDAASGCVWNIKSIIKNSELFYEIK